MQLVLDLDLLRRATESELTLTSAAACTVALVRRGLHLRAIQRPVDRIFHNLAPVCASLILVVGGAGLIAGATFAPFAIAGSSTLLLVSGIYRTWGETLALIGSRE